MAKGNRNNPGGPWTVDVDVYITADGTPPKFEIQSYLQSGPNKLLRFENNGRPGFKILFRLHDQTDSGYTFAPKARDAISSKCGPYPGTCPEAGINDVFKPVRIVGGTTLVVENPNPHPAQGTFGYTLFVTKTGDRPYQPLDPGGENQNGGAGR
jgi:hypothetical protein